MSATAHPNLPGKTVTGLKLPEPISVPSTLPADCRLDRVQKCRPTSESHTRRRTESVLGIMEGRKPRAPKSATSTSSLYSSKIIKAGALLADTKTLLAHWDTAASVQENLERIRTENLFGKASRSRVEDILAIFRQRFLTDEHVLRALTVFAAGQLPATSLDRILYFHAARADQLLRDVVTEVLDPQQARGVVDVDISQVQRVLLSWVTQGKTKGEWSEPTVRRIAQGLLSSLRDFGVLQGSVNKKIAPAFLPLEAFAYVAFYLKQHQPSGAKLVELPDWKLFFLPREGVERFLMEAHQHGILEFHAAGTVTRLTFPVETLEEYVRVLAERPH